MNLMMWKKLLSVSAATAVAMSSLIGVAAAKNDMNDTALHSKQLHDQSKQKWHLHHSVGKLKLIGEKEVSNDAIVGGTRVGGLSGIDYNPLTHQWIMISDDRSDLAPARFYTGRLNYDTHTFNSVNLTGVTSLKQPDGSTYPSRTEYQNGAKGVVPDLESIRFDPNNGSVWYTSEGDRHLGLSPFIRQASLKDGSYLSSFQLPDAFKLGTNPTSGFRNNLALEGTSFSPNGEFYFTSMEAPLYQDGSVPTVTAGGFTRITKYDRQGHILAQYAYHVSKIPAQPGPGKYADNGVSEMLAINNHEFLMLERSGVQSADGHFTDYIRIYKVDTRHATNINGVESLQSSEFKPVSKQLLLNLNTLNLPRLDNVEGIAWGPKLKNGDDSLVLVSDNNFNPSEVTQFIAFDVKPDK